MSDTDVTHLTNQMVRWQGMEAVDAMLARTTEGTWEHKIYWQRCAAMDHKWVEHYRELIRKVKAL